MYNESCTLIELCKSPFEPDFLDYKDRIYQLNNAIVFMDKRISFAGTIHPDVSVGLDEIHKSFSKVTEKQ